MPTISLVMVVKDEAATLVAAVQSALPIVDEVVIGVDRASTDATLAIARTLATSGKLFEFTFEESGSGFAGARNEALKRASGELVLILDGHECIPPDDHPVLQQVARMRGQDPDTQRIPTALATFSTLRHDGLGEAFDVACVTLAMNTDPVGIPQLFFLQPRLFRRIVKGDVTRIEEDGLGQIRYGNPVHNALEGFENARALGVPEAVLVHNMPAEREAQRKKQRARMNFAGLLADVRRERKKLPKEQNGRPFFYLGNSYADQGKPKQAIHWYEQYLHRSKFGEEKMQALQQLGILYHRHAKDVGKARRALLEAVALQWRRAEPLVLLAEIAMEEKQWEEAIHWLKLAQQYRAPHTVMFMQGSVYAYLPDLQMATCYANLEDWHEACAHLDAVLTWRPGDPAIIQQRRECMMHFKKKPGDTNLLIVDRLGSFTVDLGQYFANQGWSVTRRAQLDDRWRAWPDLVWFEWCDQNLLEGTQQPWHCPVICRLHSYEAFTDLPPHIRWEHVDALVFVAPHIRDLVLAQWPTLKDQVEMVVIPNGVSPDGLTFRERQHGHRIGYLGYLNHKKGVDILVQAIRVLPDYEFRVAGRFQDPHLEYYWHECTKDLPNIWFDGWVPPEQKDDWLEGVDYLISPSIVESFGYSIAEAMLKGLFPILHQRPGAIYPSHTFRSVNDIRALLAKPYDSTAYRQHVLDHYALTGQMEATEALFVRLRAKGKQLPERAYGVPLVDRLITE